MPALARRRRAVLLERVTRPGLAAPLAGAIGFERERLSWAAGLCTHMLVAVGACLFMIVSAYGFNDRAARTVMPDAPRRRRR